LVYEFRRIQEVVRRSIIRRMVEEMAKKYEIIGTQGTVIGYSMGANKEEATRKYAEKNPNRKIAKVNYKEDAQDSEPTHEEITKKFDVTINKYVKEGKKEEASRMMAEKAKALAALSRSKGMDSVADRAKAAADAWNGQNAHAEVKDADEGRVTKREIRALAEEIAAKHGVNNSTGRADGFVNKMFNLYRETLLGRTELLGVYEREWNKMYPKGFVK
jgi:hypothetical protein